MTKDAEHLFEDGKAPPCFLTCGRTGRKIHYWGPYKSKLSPAQRGLNGIRPPLVADFWQQMILDMESWILRDALIGKREHETAADKVERLRRAKRRAEFAAEHARAKGIRS